MTTKTSNPLFTAPFAIIAPAAEVHTIVCEDRLAAVAAYLLTDGDGYASPAVPALPVGEINSILRERRADLAAALETVEPAQGSLGTAARRLARQLRRVSHA